MRLGLAPDVHAVMVEADLVLLDVASDAYFCLPGAGDHLSLVGRSLQVGPDDLAEGLREAGLALVEPEAPIPTMSPPSSPTQSAGRMIASEPAARSAPRHLRALVVAIWTGLRTCRGPFDRLLPPVAPFATSPPTARLLADLAVYRRTIPWLPIDGACLFRSHMLRTYLEALGHRVSWVFGVRTWPFSAHCWLQVGAVALDDEAERLAAYRPIMVR